MNREEKALEIESLKQKFSEKNIFYIADMSGLTVEEVTNLRRLCHKQGVEVRVAKNTLITKALESLEKNNGLESALHGPTSLFFSEVSNLPAKIIRDFRKTKEKPLLKAAYIDASIYLGDDQLETLATLKSKEELVGEIIGLLQSPAKNVISALQSGGNKLAGIIKTLSDKKE